MSKQAVALIAGLLVVAGLLVAGCGGGDNDDANAGSPSAETTASRDDVGPGAGGKENGGETAAITKRAFIKQADKLCGEIEKGITAQGTKLFNRKETPGKKSNFQVDVVQQVLVPEYQTMVDDIEALGIPRGDESEVTELIGEMQERVDVMGEDPEGFFEPDAADKAKYNRFVVQVKGYGFKRCYQ